MTTLYTTDILRLATEIPHLGRLVQPGGSAEVRSPVCGSRIIIDVRLGEDGRLAEMAMTINACALGQASAALMGRHAIGLANSEIAAARDALHRYLTGVSDQIDFWPGVNIFAAARDYPARHAAIRLPFDAMVAAMQNK
jgi:NifU-like protein involved in Fe-S cluster formation